MSLWAWRRRTIPDEEMRCEECGANGSVRREPGSERTLCEECYDECVVRCDSCGLEYAADDDSEIILDRESSEWECVICRDHRTALARFGIY